MSITSPYIDRDVSKYVVAGKRVPSVTEILALAGIVDFAGLPADVLAAAADRGRLAHTVTAMFDCGEDPSKVAGYLAVEPYMEGYLQFRKDTGFNAQLVEFSVVSQEHRYAGTLDRLGVFGDGSLWLIDLKTSATIPRWVGLQLAGYELPVRCLVDAPRIRRAALRLRPNGTYAMHEFKDRADQADFLAAVRVAHFRLNHGVSL